MTNFFSRISGYRYNQFGFAPVMLLLLLLLVGGVVLGVYLVGNRTFFTPSASVSSPVSPEVSMSLWDVSSKCAVGDTGSACWPVKHSVGEMFDVQVLVHSDFDAANQFAAKVKFPADKFEVVSITTAAPEVSVPEIIYPVKSWLEEFYDNSSGEISLVGGVPDPGIKTEPAFKYVMATIQFKVKQQTANVTAETSVIEVTELSAIYRNSDNTNILTDPNKRRSLAVEISTAVKPIPSGVPCDLNGDGVSDKNDANFFTSKYGTSVASNRSFDLDSNGKVDKLDFAIWTKNCPQPSLSPSPVGAGISVSPTSIEVTIFRSNTGNEFFASGIKISAAKNSNADTWVIESSKSGDGFGFWTTASGITPGSEQENKLYILASKPNGKYSGNARINYYKNGNLVEQGPVLNYTISLTTGETASPSPSPKSGCEGFELGDANKDKTINLTDSSSLMTKFNKSINDCADMNSDGKINVFDLSIMRKLFINRGIIRLRPSTSSPSAVLKLPEIS